MLNQISFRDPSGFVACDEEKIYRAIGSEFRLEIQGLLNEGWYKNLVESGKIQSSSWIESSRLDPGWSWIEHPKIKFPIFPHEICAEQLYESAILTIELAKIALENGYVLKDASAWNVIFNNGKPIFIDITSFEKYRNQPLWFAYGQYCRHFILPLLIYKYSKISPSRIFLSSRDGITPAEAKKIIGLHTITSLCSIETVFLPSIFSKSTIKVQKNNPKGTQNRHIFQGTLLRLESYINSLQPANLKTKSTWSNYEDNRNHYNLHQLDEKRTFIENVFGMCSGNILDIGCNEGEYSILASNQGLKVTAVDFDEVTLNNLQSKVKESSINISYLNIAQPTPSIGWENKEYESFLDKAKEYFELVLCLGLIHHLMVSERIPLEKIISTLYGLSNRFLVVEWIEVNDVKFEEIAQQNHYLYDKFTTQIFEQHIEIKFIIKNKLRLKNSKRILYFCEKI